MLASGAILQNRYRVVRQLGHGGMGMVYLAEDRRFGSRVALKETSFDHIHLHNLRPPDQARLRKAFRQEARLLNRLRHQALPHVIDYFTEGEGHYLVMQFIDGKDLEELSAERKEKNLGPFPTDQVVEWADQLLDALEYLHGQRTPIIHRDIKPQNLKLTSRGEVILLDFGLAKGAATEMALGGSSLRGYTRHYAPLEQMEGTGTDPRSDLYALAATLHQLLTGELPPPATTRATTILSGQPDPLRPAHELNPQVPAPVAAVLSRALAQNPNERPATAKQMRQALHQSSQASVRSSSASITVIDSQAEIETSALPNEEPELVAPRPESATGRDSTYAGQTAPTTDSKLRSALAPKEISANPFEPRPRMAWPVRIAVSSLIVVSAAFASRDGHLRRTLPPPSPPARVEVMKYCLTAEAAGGIATSVAGNEPLVTGQRFKLRFTPRERGYLYIIAPNVKEVPTTFLTAQPNPDWGVRTNLIAADTDYSFPPRPDKWLRITGAAETETYLIVFAPILLPTPGFWAEPAGRALTDADQRELAAFRQQHRTEVATEQRRDQSVVSTPRGRPAGAPLIFEINVKRRIEQQ